MVNVTLCNVIAYICAVLSFLGSVFSIYVLGVGVYHYDKSFEDDEGNVVIVTGGAIAVLCLAVLLSVGQFIVSVLLIIGIQKRSPKLVLPWLVIAGVSMFCSILNLAVQARTDLILSIVGIIIGIAMAYPIFCFYRECRNTPQHPNVNYNACPHPGATVYNSQTGPVYPNANTVYNPQTAPVFPNANAVYNPQTVPMMYPNVEQIKGTV